MFCPECGEVIGPGPLDLRRAAHDARGGGRGKSCGCRLGAALGGLLGSGRRSAGRRADVKRGGPAGKG